MKRREGGSLKKSKDANKVQNPIANKPLVYQPYAQRYPSFNGYCFYCKIFRQVYIMQVKVKSKYSMFNCKSFGYKANNYSNQGMNRSYRPSINRVNESFMNMINTTFHGYCYICYGFGHKDN